MLTGGARGSRVDADAAPAGALEDGPNAVDADDAPLLDEDGVRTLWAATAAAARGAWDRGGGAAGDATEGFFALATAGRRSFGAPAGEAFVAGARVTFGTPARSALGTPGGPPGLGVSTRPGPGNPMRPGFGAPGIAGLTVFARAGFKTACCRATEEAGGNAKRDGGGVDDPDDWLNIADRRKIRWTSLSCSSFRCSVRS